MRFKYGIGIAVCCLVLNLSGCMRSSSIQSPDHQGYRPVKIDKTPPKVKEERWIEPTTKEEIEAYQKKEEMLSDFEKRERYRH